MFDFGSIADPVHVIVEVGGMALAVWGILHRDRQERKKQIDDNEQIQIQRHQENKEALAEIRTQLRYHPPHAHTEDEDQPLTEKGIQYGPKRRSNY